ncbi:MAG: GDP-mannose 4,6-dehydratase [Anaerolineae bacterium]|nr:GDP-mannose 4,6-dehydratase [Anaerolineae bacterium]MDW8103147.1 GDP-mannose 4,6-dehydratase [Anaerolineae bacterium]
MRALVTGGAGFIGSHLVDELLARGYEVVVLDDFSQGNEANLAHNFSNPSFRLVRGDVTDAPLVERLVRESDVIYHLAAVVGVYYVLQDPLRTIKVNVLGTELVLEFAHRYRKRVLVASSSEVYGKSRKRLLKERDNGIFGPPEASRWCYALSKSLDEHMALAYYRLGLEVSVVRYFNAYGPRLDPRGYGSVVARFISQALDGIPITVYGDGSQTRSFTYVSDTVRGTILAATLPQALGKIFNIGNGREISILELARLIKEKAGSQSPIIFVPYDKAYGPDFEEAPRRRPDTSRAEKLLGFKAEVSLEEGLERTIEWFKERTG